MGGLVEKAARNRRLRAVRERMHESSAEKRLLQDRNSGPIRANSPVAHRLTKQILGDTEMSCGATFIDELFPTGTAAPVVAWRELNQGKALKWTLLRRGSLGLTLPLAYVPALSLRAHGGAKAFGFTEFLPSGSPINEPSLACNMIAELTAADLDLIQPDIERELGWICSYSPGPDSKQLFQAWRKEAYNCGYILIASGDKELPVTGPDSADWACQVLMESLVAAVPVVSSTNSFNAGRYTGSPHHQRTRGPGAGMGPVPMVWLPLDGMGSWHAPSH
jgi:hypothetical protein